MNNPHHIKSRNSWHSVTLTQKKKLIILFIFAFLIFPSGAFSSDSDPPYKIQIAITDNPGKNDGQVMKVYCEGQKLLLKVEVTNLSDKASNLAKGFGFTMPVLLRDKKPVPYRAGINEQFIKAENDPAEGVVVLRSGQSDSELIDLDKFYEPLKEGSYQILVERKTSATKGVLSSTSVFNVISSPGTQAETVNSRDAEDRIVKVLRLEVDKKEVKSDYKVLIYCDNKIIEPLRKDNGFVVPKEARNSVSDVRFLFKNHDLYFNSLYPPSFNTDWVIGVDHKPSDVINASFNKPKQFQAVNYLHFVSLQADGTELLVDVKNQVGQKDTGTKNSVIATNQDPGKKSLPKETVKAKISAIKGLSGMSPGYDPRYIKPNKNVLCQYWEAQVDPDVEVDFEIDKTDPENIMEGIGCLLSLEGRKGKGTFSGWQPHVSQILPRATVEICALYYISYLYTQNWEHADGIALYGPNSGLSTDKGVELAYKSYRTWFRKLEEIGLEKARAQKFDPLTGSGVSWY